jgi:hypothetical protein
MHWLHRSVFQGHRQLDARDVDGVLQCFSVCKTPEQTSQNTCLNWDTCLQLLDRLRMASSLVAQDQRDNVVFAKCQVEADESGV